MKRQGFTLTEMLVVCGVIAILLSIAIPALSGVKKQANGVVCNSNIRQLLIIMSCYTAKHDGTFPIGFKDTIVEPPGGRAGVHTQDRTGWWWFNYLGKLYSEADSRKNILQCPSKNLTTQGLKSNILCGNYGINQSICRTFSARRETEFTGLPLKSGRINHPSQTLLLIDSGYALINWWHATDNPPRILSNSRIENTSYVPGLKINSERDLWSGQESDAIYGRHLGKKVNIGFVDGHIEHKNAADVLVEKHDEEYINRFYLWTPNKKTYN